MKPVEPQGYIIPAFNVGTVDYVDCARYLAKSLLSQHPGARICLLTNDTSNNHNDLFAHVKVVSTIDTQNPWSNDWLVFYQSPFRETVKLEADCIVTSPIDHWWTLFRNRDIVISTGCRNWRGEVSESRHYRKCFDENHLPDVYNAITYWRLSTTAKEFFDLVRDIFTHWEHVKRLLKYPEDVPSTDLVYAIAAKIMGPELTTIPFVDYPQIVHMKKHHAGTATQRWSEELVWEHNPLRIQTIAQWGVFHYNQKDWR